MMRLASTIFPLLLCPSLLLANTFQRRIDYKLLGVKTLVASGDSELNITDSQDFAYIAQAEIAGQTYSLQLDSGSSDLWIDASNATTIPGNVTDLNQTVSFAIGSIGGPIATAPVSFAGFDVPAQAYIASTQSNNPVLTFGAQGVLGMGFTSLSAIDFKVNATGASWGRSLLYNIFSQNPTEPNFVAYKLQRESDNDNDQGTFSIGEILPEYNGILDTGKIFTYPANNPKRWTLLVDDIIASGQKIEYKSVIDGVPSGQFVGLADTGSSLVFAPQEIVDKIYANIPGATWNDNPPTYLLHCDVEVDVSIVINNRQFDIHPLDMVIPAGTTADGNPQCAGTWRPQAPSKSTPSYDVLFGASFMRSVYSLYDFGDFAADNKTLGQPYMRFWSLVNGSDASDEFHSVRGGTKNSTFLSNKGVNDPGADSVAHNVTGNAADGSSTDLSALVSKVDNIDKLVPILFALTGLNLAVLIGIVVVFLFTRSRRRRRAKGSKGGRVSKGDKPAKLSPVPTKDEEDLPPPESPGSFIALPRPRAPALQNTYRPLSSGSTLRDSTLYDAPKSPGSSNGKFNPDAKYDPHIARQSSASAIPEESFDPPSPSFFANGARQSVAGSSGPFSTVDRSSSLDSPSIRDSLDPLGRQSFDPLMRQSVVSNPFTRQSAVVLESDLSRQSVISPSIAGIMITAMSEAEETASVRSGVSTSGSDRQTLTAPTAGTSSVAIPLVPLASSSHDQLQFHPQPQELQMPPRQGVLPVGSPPTLRRPNNFAGLAPPEPGYVPTERHSAAYAGLQPPDTGGFEQPSRHSIASNEKLQQFEPPPREAFMRSAEPSALPPGAAPASAPGLPPSPQGNLSAGAPSPLRQAFMIPQIDEPASASLSSAPLPPNFPSASTLQTIILAQELSPPPVAVPRQPFVPGATLFPDGGYSPPRAVSLYDPPVMPQAMQRPLSQYDQGQGPASPPIIPPRSTARFNSQPQRPISALPPQIQPPSQGLTIDAESANASVNTGLEPGNASPALSHRSRRSSRAPSLADSRKE